jgi:putative RecB family exonuclease
LLGAPLTVSSVVVGSLSARSSTVTVMTDDEVGLETGPGPATDGEGPRRRALSASRAADFKTCPLMYRYRAIDKIPEPPSPPAVRGTLVHAALERLYAQPAAHRTEATAAAALPELWAALVEQRPELAGMVPEAELDAWFTAAGALLHTYFGLEDPTRLEPQACELRVEVDLADGVPARGFIDRLDVSPGGLIRVVDYKTGKSPADSYAGDVLFQLKFYALMLYRLRGVVAARLRLVYLGDAQLLEYTPDEAGLLSFERGVVALWRAIEQASATGVFPARRGRLCDWCSFQSICPEFGGTPPPYPGLPDDAVAVTTPANTGPATIS